MSLKAEEEYLKTDENQPVPVAAPEIQCYQVIARSITLPTRSRENRESLCRRGI